MTSQKAVVTALAFAMCTAASVSAAFATPAFIVSEGVGEMRVAKLIGVTVKNKAGETVGDINDIVISSDGRVAALVIGVGGFLGMAEKNVAVPFGSVAVTAKPDGTRTAEVDATKQALDAAPAYKSERTTFERVQDSASGMANAARKKAEELAAPKPEMSK